MKIFDKMQNFFESIREYVKNFSNLFWIFLGAFLLVSVIIIIITSSAYECKLTKTIDKLNRFLERNPRINDDNLVAFNNLMKANSVPKTLRRQWQQFMLYREHSASYYMSFKHCVENPLRNSAFSQQMVVYKIVSYVLIALSLITSTFMSNQSMYTITNIREIFIIPITILVLYWLINMVLNLIHSAISGDLFQNYQYFEINIDKAMLTLPEFVDYEVLFSQDEIRRGIPVLFAYLQKRAIQEQQELEKARLKNADHEKFDFEKAGLDGSLVLDRAMRETENYTAQRKKYMQEIERVNNEIGTLENNYREQTKEYQRQVQTSKETVENLKEQLEQAGSTIEINYIKKQMRDELTRQQIAEKDFDTRTDKHNQDIKNLNQEIKSYEEEIKKAKEAMEVAMLSEFNTYSVKVYDNLEKIVEDKMQDSVDDFKEQIKGLEVELEEKNEELESVYTRYQEVLAQVPAEEEQFNESVGKKKKKKSHKDEPVDDGMVQPEYIDEYNQEYSEYTEPNYNEDEQYYDEYTQANEDYNNYDYNQIDNNETYSNNNYADTFEDVYNEDNYQFDSQYQENDIPNSDYYENSEYVPTDEYIAEEYVPTEDYLPANDYSTTDGYVENAEYVPTDDAYMYQNQDSNNEYYNNDNEFEYVPLAEEQGYQSVDSNNETYIPLDEQQYDDTRAGDDANQYNEQDEYQFINDVVSESLGENTSVDQDAIEEFNSSDFEIDNAESNQDDENSSFDFDFDDETEGDINLQTESEEGDIDLNDILGLYDNIPDARTENAFAEIKVENENSNTESNSEDVEDEPIVKRKAGRPRKVIDEADVKPKRSVGRPRKEKSEDDIDKPKRKAGRPRKIVVEEDIKPKRAVGRPRKEKSEDDMNKPKRKAGRPRKENTESKTTEAKRKAGRPKKTEEVSSVKSTASKSTGKRGRPRKVEAESSVIDNKGVLGKPKRKAGRPKKDKK